MKKLILTFSATFLGLTAAANAAPLSYAERMKVLQENQHTRPNAQAYVNSLQKAEPKPQRFGMNRGHFHVPVNINGNEVNMMADTGASAIFLSQEDAQKAGINMGSLNYNIPYDTANGKVYAAEVIAPRLQVGDIVLENVPVTVNQSKNNDMSLLGMEFFSRLSKYEVRDGVLTLYK